VANDKTLVLLGVGVLAYLYFSKSGIPGVTRPILPQPYPGTAPPNPNRVGGTTGGGTSGGGTGGGISGGGTTPSGAPRQTTTPSGVPLPPNDSGDPCDPNSYAYDATTCASYTGADQYTTPPAPVDTFDPCDPYSSVYDPSQCGSAVDTTGTSGGGDSMDPCDPTSSMYDEYACAEMP
jgi:hypothetical protein